MDPNLLQDQAFITYLSTELKAFLSINTPSVNSPSLLWETAKAYIRGLIISYSATKRRQNLEQQSLLEKRLKKIAEGLC